LTQVPQGVVWPAATCDAGKAVSPRTGAKPPTEDSTCRSACPHRCAKCCGRATALQAGLPAVPAHIAVRSAAGGLQRCRRACPQCLPTSLREVLRAGYSVAGGPARSACPHRCAKCCGRATALQAGLPTFRAEPSPESRCSTVPLASSEFDSKQREKT
jgi:hypothetical protein